MAEEPMENLALSKLFKMVSNSEAVEIIYQPVALAVLSDGRVFLESDPDPYGIGIPHLEDVRTAARAAGIENSIDWDRASRVLVMVEGVARRIDQSRQSVADREPLPKPSIQKMPVSNDAADDRQSDPSGQN